MQKSIHALLSKIQTSENGNLKGGFVSIRGGVSLVVAGHNVDCTNTYVCSGTNAGGCTNTRTCSDSTNLTQFCSNTGWCII
jgi:hypothetical protein